MNSLKKFVIAAALVSSGNVALAGSKALVSSDGSDVSALCVSAATSSLTLKEYAAKIGISRSELDTIHCNGLPISRFVLKYGSTSAVTLVSTPVTDEKSVGYALKMTDTSPLTELCAAAAVSAEAYAKVKDEHFRNDTYVESEVFCNGVPLKSFARRFRDVEATLVSQL